MREHAVDPPRRGRRHPAAAAPRGEATFLLADAPSERLPLADGQVLSRVDPVLGPVALRLHLPGGVASTLEASRDLLKPGLSVEFDRARLTATLHQGRAAVTVRGECARVLALYVRARNPESADSGSLRPSEAWTGWVAAGGNAQSPLDRLSWERGELRTQLARLRVANVDALFELSREGETIRTRIGVLLTEL